MMKFLLQRFLVSRIVSWIVGLTAANLRAVCGQDAGMVYQHFHGIFSNFCTDKCLPRYEKLGSLQTGVGPLGAACRSRRKRQERPADMFGAFHLNAGFKH